MNRRRILILFFSVLTDMTLVEEHLSLPAFLYFPRDFVVVALPDVHELLLTSRCHVVSVLDSVSTS